MYYYRNLKKLSLVIFLHLLLQQYYYSVKSNTINVDYYNTLVYKKCSNQTFHDTKSQSQALVSLFQELVHQSSNSKFFKSTAGEDYKGVSGFYQCRMDLSSKECYKCVKKLTELSCHGSASGRIQLPGCYIHYEADDDTPPSVYKNFIAYRKTELLHKSCGKAIEDDIIGFENMRDYALLEVENGAMEYGHSEVSYELVHAMAQCEEGFVGCDCGECVTNGVQIVVQDCATSNVGEVYLDKCFVKFNYYPHRIPDNRNGKRSGNGTSKKLAIVLGGGAALAFVFIFLMCIQSMRKKHDDY